MMPDLKLFRIDHGVATEIHGHAMALERSLQTLIESNMEEFFGVRFLKSEHNTGAKHGGRMDSLGIDENFSPVIFEYKRATNENVINQGLFYLDWLLDHRAEFQLLVQEKLGHGESLAIDWRNPRLICIAGDFTKYDTHAVTQINRSIDLVRYRDFDGKLLALELVHTSGADSGTSTGAPETPLTQGSPRPSTIKTVTDYLNQADPQLKELVNELEAFVLALGDGVTRRTLKHYIAYRSLRNFMCLTVHPQARELLLYLRLNPKTVKLEPGFSRDVSQIGHIATGNLEIRLSTKDTLTKATHLIQRSYDES